jgi:hypothetical protein
MTKPHETLGKSDEWYTPRYLFDAMGVKFDLDVTPARLGQSFVPAHKFLKGDGLIEEWEGFVWMNPPFGARNGLEPWLNRFLQHGNGVALTPDRTSSPWWQAAAKKSDAIIFMAPKVKFHMPSGEVGASPANGTTLFAKGWQGIEALKSAKHLGILMSEVR